MSVCVTGAGGFIGWHLVRRLKAEGHRVIGVDIKPPAFAPTDADVFKLLDLRSGINAVEAVHGCDWVFALAADMGGMGFIAFHDAEIMRNNALINLNTLEAARLMGVQRYFFASSACVYPDRPANDAALREVDAYPVQPDNEYGWEKLYAERALLAHGRSYAIEPRIARFHNCYGENGTWRGGREKAPAALCRKVAEAKLAGAGHIDVWGDGTALRSYMYIDDLIEGILRLMQSDCAEPLNLGTDAMVSVDDLARAIMAVAGVDLEIRHVPGPVGVRARNSDNTRCRAVLGWAPGTRLSDGLARLYPWIEQRVREGGL